MVRVGATTECKADDREPVWKKRGARPLQERIACRARFFRAGRCLFLLLFALLGSLFSALAHKLQARQIGPRLVCLSCKMELLVPLLGLLLLKRLSTPMSMDLGRKWGKDDET